MNVFFMEVRNLRKSALVSTLSIGGAIFAMLAFFPAMQTESMQALAGAKLEGIDPSLLAALGLRELVDFSVITNFFGYLLQFIALAVMVVVTQQAVGLLIKEETGGTIEYLCAKPVSRLEIFSQKGLAHVVIFFVSSAIWAAVTMAGYLLFSEYTFGEAAAEAVTFFSAIFFIGMVFSAVGVLLSTLLKNGRATAGITVAIVFGSFILGIMSATIGGLDFLKW
ncbi:MAG: ABC transporter permease, partial [Oscillospiraceae bacterium]|nr:ABC transporter permease [Oscillospiraceae bacterium]